MSWKFYVYWRFWSIGRFYRLNGGLWGDYPYVSYRLGPFEWRKYL